MKRNKIIIIILSLIIVCLVCYFVYHNITKQEKAWVSNDYIESYQKEKIIYDCSFTKTYMISNLWTVDTTDEIPGMSYIMIKQFQSEDVITAIIPTELRDKLQQGKYYEFTYMIKGKDKIIETMEDINDYFALDYNNPDFKITLSVKETDKQGLEQIQDDICSYN